jgi:hypothetical protein
MDYDGCTQVFNQKYVTAKKKHKCCECGSIINPGDKYEYVFMVCDNDPSTSKTCMPCADIRRDIAPCACFGELRLEIQECLGFDYLEDPGDMEDE